MPQNIEVKAKVKSLESLKKKAQQISGEDATVLKQEDTFFNVEKGRLKLRVIEASNVKLCTKYNMLHQFPYPLKCRIYVFMLALIFTNFNYLYIIL